MAKIRVYTGSRPSASAMALVEKLRENGHDAKRIRTEGSRYRPRANHVIVNYGSSTVPESYAQTAHVINGAEGVARAVNKIKTFDILVEAGIRVPEYVVPSDAPSVNASHLERIAAWRNGALFRTTVTGTGGEGITHHVQNDPNVRELFNSADTRPALVQQYIRKNGEYRVHVFNGEVIDLQKKRRRGDEETAANANSIVRNLENGWVYCRNNVTLSDEYKQMCIDAVTALGLDFGAVDFITTSRHGYVLEVNSAPGLQGATLDSYAGAFEALLNDVVVR